MSTTLDERSGTVYDPLSYFDGGREGVQRRFGEILRERITRIPYGQVITLSKEEGINPRDIGRLVEGDYSVVSGDMIENLGIALGITNLRDGFGNPNISPDERSRLAKILALRQDSMNDLTLMTHALERLDTK
jgi:hypothetical protein